MTNVALCLIHNGEYSRTQNAISEIEQFKILAPEIVFVDTVLIGWQPDFTKPKFITLIWKEMRTFVYLLRWNKYIEATNPIFNFFSAVGSTLFRIIGLAKNPKAWARKSFAEMQLTIKHSRSWEAFLETDAEWLITLEDDIFLSNDCGFSMVKLQKFLQEEASVQPSFISLSNQFTLKELKISRLVSRHEGTFVFLKKPSSNTTAAYALNREAVRIMATEYRNDVGLRYLNADLLLNELFIRSKNSRISFESFLVIPEIFENGTVTGRLESSIS